MQSRDSDWIGQEGIRDMFQAARHVFGLFAIACAGWAYLIEAIAREEFFDRELTGCLLILAVSAWALNSFSAMLTILGWYLSGILHCALGAGATYQFVLGGILGAPAGMIVGIAFDLERSRQGKVTDNNSGF